MASAFPVPSTHSSSATLHQCYYQSILEHGIETTHEAFTFQGTTYKATVADKKKELEEFHVSTERISQSTNPVMRLLRPLYAPGLQRFSQLINHPKTKIFAAKVNLFHCMNKTEEQNQKTRQIVAEFTTLPTEDPSCEDIRNYYLQSIKFKGRDETRRVFYIDDVCFTLKKADFTDEDRQHIDFDKFKNIVVSPMKTPSVFKSSHVERMRNRLSIAANSRPCDPFIDANNLWKEISKSTSLGLNPKKVQAYINYLMFRYQSAAKSEPTLISSNSSFSGLDNVHHALNDLLHLWNRDDFREGHTLLTELKGTLGDSTFSFYKLDELQDIFTRQLAFTEQR